MNASAEEGASRPSLGGVSHAVQHLLDLQVSKRMQAISAVVSSCGIFEAPECPGVLTGEHP